MCGIITMRCDFITNSSAIIQVFYTNTVLLRYIFVRANERVYVHDRGDDTLLSSVV